MNDDAPLITTVRDVLARHALLTKETTIALALSGGSDSTCLFHAILPLRERYGITLVGVHVNYNLRGWASRKDRAFVETLTTEADVPLYTLNVSPARFDGKNVQAYARKVRFRYFRRLHREGVFDALLLAHHAHDQAETILYRVAKGTGIKGLVGMRERRGFFIRPLLTVPKPAIARFLHERGIAYRVDESNRSMKYARNRIRHEVLPSLSCLTGNVVAHIQALSEQASHAYALIRKEAGRVMERALSLSGTTYTLALSHVRNATDGTRREVLAETLRRTGVSPSLRKVRALEDVIASTKPNITLTWHNALVITKAYDTLTFAGGEALLPTAWRAFPLYEGDVRPLPSSDTFVTLRLRAREDVASFATTTAVYFASARVTPPITLRPREAGDRLRAYPAGKTLRVKNLFIDRKIPVGVRARVPIITESDGRVIAVCPGFVREGEGNRVATDVAVADDTAYVWEVAIAGAPFS